MHRSPQHFQHHEVEKHKGQLSAKLPLQHPDRNLRFLSDSLCVRACVCVCVISFSRTLCSVRCASVFGNTRLLIVRGRPMLSSCIWTENRGR